MVTFCVNPDIAADIRNSTKNKRLFIERNYIIVAAPAPEIAAIITLITSNATFHQLTFFMFYDSCKFLYVVIKPEDTSCQ